MGLLTVGTPLSWEDTKKYAEKIKKHGILQFINLYKNLKDRQRDTLKWGDEIEYTLIYIDHKNKSARLLLKCSDILHVLQEEENNNPGSNQNAWRMEYADYMVEGTPGQPFGGCLKQFNRVEASMRSRREELMRVLKENETVICFASFPRIGCPGFTEPILASSPALNPSSNSLYYPDRAIYPSHPRFKTLTKNIRSRRGSRPSINIPVFRDINTPEPYNQDIPNDDGEAKLAVLPNHVYMDCMGFGMGCCCLQVTFQACNIKEARMLYDQLTVLAPIMLALSAASPAFQGMLTDIDVRWGVISASVDDRTKEERGELPLKNDKFRIPKSRYSSVDMYISECSSHLNDIPVNYEEEHKQMLIDAGIDETLAIHIAHLFIRDPVSLFAEKINLNDEVDTDHFENIQSTNWQSVRFKPPPSNSKIGWRVEFRSMEVQLTDFENAAYVVFIVLLTRVILSYKLNFLLPISKVEENMKRAMKRDAVKKELFYFRNTTSYDASDEQVELTIDSIINGQDNGFPGLISLIRSYLDSIDVDIDVGCTIKQYLCFISRKASGNLQTMASYMRNYICSHPEYKKDSFIPEAIMYDLSVHLDKVSQGKIGCPSLFGNPSTKSLNVTPPNCVKVSEEVEELTKKILSVKRINEDKLEERDTLQDNLTRSLGVDVIIDSNLQM
ncbi:glutamate--cysteine ligase catalytic subunit isoform X1 [Hydra vulgaris]|uniref:Glutamate--cysteine ligase n=1 Tax=Hydra vulgaris TaxID=6087 RepID=T2MFL4_HYDVU|nr:glutamate--cysteine ligase catalytic subunit [Hydra vulgaris]